MTFAPQKKKAPEKPKFGKAALAAPKAQLQPSQQNAPVVVSKNALAGLIGKAKLLEDDYGGSVDLTQQQQMQNNLDFQLQQQADQVTYAPRRLPSAGLPQMSPVHPPAGSKTPQQGIQQLQQSPYQQQYSCQGQNNINSAFFNNQSTNHQQQLDYASRVNQANEQAVVQEKPSAIPQRAKKISEMTDAEYEVHVKEQEFRDFKRLVNRIFYGDPSTFDMAELKDILKQNKVFAQYYEAERLKAPPKVDKSAAKAEPAATAGMVADPKEAKAGFNPVMEPTVPQYQAQTQPRVQVQQQPAYQQVQEPVFNQQQFNNQPFQQQNQQHFMQQSGQFQQQQMMQQGMVEQSLSHQQHHLLLQTINDLQSENKLLASKVGQLEFDKNQLMTQNSDQKLQIAQLQNQLGKFERFIEELQSQPQSRNLSGYSQIPVNNAPEVSLQQNPPAQVVMPPRKAKAEPQEPELNYTSAVGIKKSQMVDRNGLVVDLVTRAEEAQKRIQNEMGQGNVVNSREIQREFVQGQMMNSMEQAPKQQKAASAFNRPSQVPVVSVVPDENMASIDKLLYSAQNMLQKYDVLSEEAAKVSPKKALQQLQNDQNFQQVNQNYQPKSPDDMQDYYQEETFNPKSAAKDRFVQQMGGNEEEDERIRNMSSQQLALPPQDIPASLLGMGEPELRYEPESQSEQSRQVGSAGNLKKFVRQAKKQQ